MLPESNQSQQSRIARELNNKGFIANYSVTPFPCDLGSPGELEYREATLGKRGNTYLRGLQRTTVSEREMAMRRGPRSSFGRINGIYESRGSFEHGHSESLMEGRMYQNSYNSICNCNV